ncbi:MAG: hypothetical protein A2087_06740 [Spirochaetes bacterium GWD1_61_31]|nr:MAG: hypothetical protein A2Y37_08730 [Spirochaetes bacterium GWB1_60_80]OHD31857.1 MAG: hypothetical protein A2004_10110 [Spirochaetes bacterium GWC1_61_12]OHD40046.1 MAG: hypothetical protein A2087_06740 [Spirochaetes bacterium GWD1_61_31]OHD42300.1 MAG: hypothetical protein A2Y35_11260 [Spirochaetes bacterium GWE1_60_18]OHD58449.1 MAG: hypothetical protein A2Y32_06755 [Spirochaetes bacterium GWF1_60_12]HAP44002.1 4Fe-4S ferredoxin [Spirochaetaceae bacterium]
MKTLLAVFSGTGSALWAARQLAEGLGDCDIKPVTQCRPDSLGEYEGLGLVFPVHMWGPPTPVRRFARQAMGLAGKFVFGVAVHAGQVANALGLLAKDLRAAGGRLAAGFDLEQASNYLPWGEAAPSDQQAVLNAAARAKIAVIVAAIKARHASPYARGPLKHRLFLSGFINGLTRSVVLRMDRSFTVSDYCTACGLCARLCPVANIELVAGKPTWRQHCTQCYACLHWCPTAAIDYGPNTAGRARYHHLEVNLAGYLKFAESGRPGVMAPGS